MTDTGRRKRRNPDQTRLRIVEALVALHEEVGPARTTVSAVAERAGVQRLTVYRHFPDEAAMIGACSAHWNRGHPAPDPAAWSTEADPRTRLLVALQALYGFYRGGAEMLDNVLRDEATVPAVEEVMRPWWAYLREVAGGLATGWPVDPARQRDVRAMVGHAVRFESWRTLADEGVDDGTAARLMACAVSAVAQGCGGT